VSPVRRAVVDADVRDDDVGRDSDVGWMAYDGAAAMCEEISRRVADVRGRYPVRLSVRMKGPAWDVKRERSVVGNDGNGLSESVRQSWPSKTRPCQDFDTRLNLTNSLTPFSNPVHLS
jgi:hypothetical protein